MSQIKKRSFPINSGKILLNPEKNLISYWNHQIGKGFLQKKSVISQLRCQLCTNMFSQSFKKHSVKAKTSTLELIKTTLFCYICISSVECKRVASAFWWFFRRSFFLFYNKMCIGYNLNLILNDWKVIGLYL